MTFIEMLQQGGYILPQYSSGQQTYQAPNAGMQTLQTMMQIDQQGQNRYMQGEQLNLQRSQNTQNIIDSTIRNRISIEQNERLKKQLDLSNKKLEFEMQKAILDDLDAQRTEIQSSFLTRDQLLYDDLLKKQGLDQASMLGKMKGEQSMENWMEHRINERAFRSTFKNGYTNMQTYTQAKSYVDKTSEELKRAKILMDNKILDGNTYEKYVVDAQKAAAELAAFENGTAQAIDFKSSHWARIIGAPDFLDEAQMKHNITIENQVKEAARLEDIANANMITQTTPSKIKLNEAKSRLDIAKANSEISDMEFEQGIRKLQDEEWNMWMQKNPNASIDERIASRNKIYSNVGGKSTSGYASAEQMYAEGVRTGNQELINAAIRWKTADNNKSTDVNYRYDGNGKVEGIVQADKSIDYGGRTVDKDGVTVTSITLGNEVYKITGGSGKDKDQVIGLPFDASLIEMMDPITGRKKGYLKIKGNNTTARDWVYSKYGESHGWGTGDDELEAFSTKSKAPTGTIYKDGYLYIPQDDISIQPTAPSVNNPTNSSVVNKYYPK